jgi:hypothetical protein
MTPMTHRRRRQLPSTPVIAHIQPLPPLLQAMVELELVSLQEEEKPTTEGQHLTIHHLTS